MCIAALGVAGSTLSVARSILYTMVASVANAGEKEGEMGNVQWFIDDVGAVIFEKCAFFCSEDSSKLQEALLRLRGIGCLAPHISSCTTPR